LWKAVLLYALTPTLPQFQAKQARALLLIRSSTTCEAVHDKECPVDSIAGGQPAIAATAAAAAVKNISMAEELVPE
jgi:hypothetical protein